jgi:TatA/E family protein of Tat protein translocase
MTLLGIGPGELILILLLALVIFGPNKLPEMARNIGKALNEFRKTSQEVTSAVTRELDLAELTKEAKVTAPPLPTDEIRPIHNIPLDSVGKVQVVESPYVAPVEEPVEVEEPAQEKDASPTPPSQPEDPQTNE